MPMTTGRLPAIGTFGDDLGHGITSHACPGAPSAVCVWPTFIADNRKIAAARFAERRVLVFSTLPPDILLPGAKVSQDVKCFSVGHRRMSIPHSPTSFKAV